MFPKILLPSDFSDCSAEAARAAEELNSQAEELRNMVAEFRISAVKAVAGPRVEQRTGNTSAPVRFAKPATSVNRIVKSAAPSKPNGGNGGVKGNGYSKKIAAPAQLIPLDESDFDQF